MDRHIPSLADVLAIREQLVHKIREGEAALLEDASLAVLSKDHVGRVESRSGPNSDALFASGDLVSLSETFAWRRESPRREMEGRTI